MPDTAEPSNPPHRKRHVLRWIIIGMALLVCAGALLVFKWGDSKNMPGFVKVWKLRGDVLLSHIRHGRDEPETLFAQRSVADELFAQGSYRSAERQFRSLLASEERIFGTNAADSSSTPVWVAECLFLQGIKDAAVPLMREALKGQIAQSQTGLTTPEAAFSHLPIRLAELGKRDEALTLFEFRSEQGRQVFKNNSEALRIWAWVSQKSLQLITNAASKPSAR